MESVGVRELKSGLSRYLNWAHALVVSGRAQWAGGKPTGAANPHRIAAARSVSLAVIEDRR